MSDTTRRLSPTSRPPVALRAFIGLIGIGAGISAVAVLLSDRAPDLLKTMFGDVVVRVSRRVDAAERADAALGEKVPQTDAIVHIGIWATLAVLVGFALWTWWGLIATVATLAVGSLAVEVAQGRYTDTRAVERSDALANMLGIVAGAAVCTAAYIVWSGVAGAMNAGRRHQERVRQPA